MSNMGMLLTCFGQSQGKLNYGRSMLVARDGDGSKLNIVTVSHPRCDCEGSVLVGII